MKSNKIILFVSIIGSFLHSAVNNVQVQEAQKTQLKDAQSLLLKQAFLSIKPQSEGLEHASESMSKFIKEENTNKVLIGVRQLFPDRVSYLKALALQADSEKYPAFAALLYNKPQEEERLASNISRKAKVMIAATPCLAFVGGIIFTCWFKSQE